MAWRAAFAVSTCLLLLTVAVNLGFADRAGRRAWTTPTAASPASTATAVASTRTDFYGYWRLSRSADPSVTALVVAFGIVFASLGLLGPGVLGLLGRAMGAGARGPARLIAGRCLVDDPEAA